MLYSINLRVDENLSSYFIKYNVHDRPNSELQTGEMSGTINGTIF